MNKNGSLNIGFFLLFAGLAIAQPPVQRMVNINNAGTTGTTVNKLAKLTGAPSTAVISGAGDTSGALGIVIAGAGTTGQATIQEGGETTCVFDGATTAGHYVQISATTAGDCHDAGASFPTSGGQVIGVVLSTNGGGGTYTVDMALRQSAVPSAAVVPAGSAVTDAQCWASASTFGVCVSEILAAIAAPSTPAAGKGVIYIDSTSKNFAEKNDAGIVNHGVQTKTCTNQLLRNLADDGSTLCATVQNADLANPATTVGGATCTLGSTCNPSLGTGSTFTYVAPVELVLGVCQNATATISVSTPASNPPSPGCSGGSNTTFGFAQFSATSQTLQARITLPADWASGAGNDVTFIFADVTDNNGAHNEVFNFQTVKVSNGATQDPSFSAAQLATVAVQGTVLQRNSATITTFTCTSCAAGDTLFLKFGLDSSRTATGNANLQSIIVKLKRTVTTL